MKRIGLLLYLSIVFLVANAQIPRIEGKCIVSEKIHGLDTVTVLIFDKIDSNTNIEFEGTNVNWYTYNNLTTPVVPTKNIYYPDDATGYRVNVDGKFVNLWVIDYQNYKPTFSSLTVDNSTESKCTELSLNLNGIIPELKYKTFSGVEYVLPREFEVSYKTLHWSDKWNEQDTTVIVNLPASEITVPAPLCNTKFVVKGDQYARELFLPLVSDSSSEYSAIAVKCIPTSITTIREGKNEAERPSLASTISGSAPLDIQFLSNANEPVAKFYKWEIFKDKALLISRNDKDHRYTFTQAGSYTIKVTSSNQYCSYSDSLKVTVSESKIEVPNVFTPNGDGFNDEFKIAYKSIVDFECWVYNRWGRLVYHWNDPTKGWDGTINGRKASAGPYFYIIKAYGSDYNAKSERDKNSKLRVGEYVLKGDINLLRGKE